MREGTDFEFDLRVNLATWTLGLLCLWRLLEIGTRMAWTFGDWAVLALIPFYVAYIEFHDLRRRALLADDWH